MPAATRRAVRLRVALVVLAGILAYANALSGPFVLDDQDTIVANNQIRQLSPSVVLFPATELPVAGRPIVNLSFALNYAFGGLDVRGYHIVNVAIHIACALLLFGVVRRTFDLPALGDRFGSRSTDLAFAAGLIWLVHPLQTDAVDYVTQRTELMMGLFYMLTLYAGIRGLERRRWPAIAVLACALGMASKESMVTAPFMVAMYDRIFVFGSLREAWQRRGRFYLSLAATWALLAALMWSGPRFRSAGFASGVSAWTYLLNQTVMIVRYLRVTIWPAGLVVDYGPPRPLTVGEAMPYAAVVIALAALTIWALVKKPALGFLGAWFFVTLAPTSSIVPIATEVGAERRMYLPLAALAVLAVVGLAWLLERWADSASPETREEATSRAHVAGMITLAVVAVALAAGTVARNRDYATRVSLARTTLERWPTPRARHILGLSLLLEDQHEEGIKELRQAIASDPRASYTLGVALFQEGKLDEAVIHLREFLVTESLRIEAPTAHEMIGRALKTQGKLAEAADEFRQVLRMTPSNMTVHGLLAETLLRLRQFDEAIGHLQQFLVFRPNDVSGLMQLGVAYTSVGRQDEAVAQFRRIVDLLPGDAGAHRNLARALIEKREFEEAELQARTAVTLSPDDPGARDALGIALAAQGRLDGAIAELRRAVQLDPSDAEVRAHLEAALVAKGGPGRP